MTDPMLKRLSLALYRKAEALGLCVDPEGSGDLGPSTVLVMTVLEEMKKPDMIEAMARGMAAVCRRSHDWPFWVEEARAAVDAIKGGK